MKPFQTVSLYFIPKQYPETSEGVIKHVSSFDTLENCLVFSKKFFESTTVHT